MLTNILDSLTILILTVITVALFLLIGLVTINLAINYQAYFFVVVGIGFMWLGYNGK
jgi:hypothetical protein